MHARRRELIDELVRARQQSELSQTELAARMGTSQSAVARLESGHLDARLSTLERYAAALGRTVDWTIRPSEESP
jgi:predicted transcriptional regulator